MEIEKTYSGFMQRNWVPPKEGSSSELFVGWHNIKHDLTEIAFPAEDF